MGSGLEYGLDKVEFHHTNWTDITVKIDGTTRKDWRFWSFELGKGHWVSYQFIFPRSCDLVVKFYDYISCLNET